MGLHEGLNMEFDKFFPFDDYRPYQKECIQKILEAYHSGKKYFILEAPTGIGKSGIAYTISQYIMDHHDKKIKELKVQLKEATEKGDFEEISKLTLAIKNEVWDTEKPPFLVCTKTRQLQQQYVHAFPTLGLLWSASHYSCDMMPGEDEWYFGSPCCIKGQCPYFKKSTCKYKAAKLSFKTKTIGILNYHYFLYSDFSPHTLILDEAHNIEDVLSEIMAVELRFKTIEAIYKKASELDLIKELTKEEIKTRIDFLLGFTSCDDDSSITILEEFKNEIEDIFTLANGKLSKYRSKISDDDIESGSVSKTTLKKMATVSALVSKSGNLIDSIRSFLASEQQWVLASKDQEGLKLKPLKIDQMSEKLFSRSDFVLLMSATICGAKQFCREVGIPEKDCEFMSVPSVIPIKQRQIYSLDLGTLNYQNKDTLFPKFINHIDTLISKIEKDKGMLRGIIHSVSYDNAKKILDTSKHSKRMIIPTSTEVMDISSVLKTYPDTIVVSPRIIEGVDLIGDLSRFQFFPKVPYPFLGDAWIKGKMDNDPEWYARQTIIKIVQGAGRSVRGDDDWALTFVLDSSFRRLYQMNTNMFPYWFRQAVKLINVQSK